MTKESVKSALARAYSTDAEPEFVSLAPNGRDEMWAIGKTAFVVPVVPSDAPPELEFALRVRRNALLTGQCDECGAVAGSQFETKIATLNVAGSLISHRRNCPAADDLALAQLDRYYTERRERTIQDALDAASRSTKNDLEEELAIRGREVVSSKSYEGWAQSLLDRKSNGQVVQMCDHLRASPAQTWTMLLGLDNWHCTECWNYLQYEIVGRRFSLGLTEEFTCDHCRRYVSELQPLVVRISNVVLRGGMCRRCAREARRAEN